MYLAIFHSWLIYHLSCCGSLTWYRTFYPISFFTVFKKWMIFIFRYLSEHKTSCHSGKAGTNNFGSYHAYKKANSYYDMVKRENMDSTDLPDDLVHCPECAKPVKAKAIVIHFRRAHGRLPPGMNFLAFFCHFG